MTTGVAIALGAFAVMAIIPIIVAVSTIMSIIGINLTNEEDITV
jgi:hypothetical protein